MAQFRGTPGFEMDGDGSQTNGGEPGVTPASEAQTPPKTRSWPAHVGTPKEITGTENLAAAKWLANQALACAWPAWYAKPEQQTALSEAAIEASWASMKEMRPADIVEGMLAAQMVAVHGASMGCLEQANRGRNISTVKEFELRLGVRLLRTFAQQVEALHRWRGDGRRRRLRTADTEERVGRSLHVAKHV